MSFNNSPIGSCSYLGLPITTSLSNYILNAGDTYRQAVSRTIATASDLGYEGEICWDSGWIYVCTATDTWKRAALSTW